MARVKSRWMQEPEPFDNDLNDLILELRAFHEEFSEDNDRAEERERERARQYISIWEV